VIAVAETVIDKRTVMVEVFDTASTKHAMEGSFGLYYFVVGAKVNKIEISVQEFFRQVDEVKLFTEVARIDCSTNYIGRNQ
jgi:hypothetical protein